MSGKQNRILGDIPYQRVKIFPSFCLSGRRPEIEILTFVIDFFYKNLFQFYSSIGFFYGSPEIFVQIVLVVAEILECGFFRGVRM